MFHWMLGALAVFSGVLLLLIALLNQARTARLQREVSEAHNRSAHFVEEMRGRQRDRARPRHAGRGDRALRRIQGTSCWSGRWAASDRSGFFHVTSKTLRLFLQSMMLGAGRVASRSTARSASA